MIAEDKAMERFLDKVVFPAPGGCWVWTASKTYNGYGLFWHEGKTVLAHRFSYEQHTGTISAGLELDHLCRMRHCVNPAHLEEVTGKENLRRSPIHKESVRRNGRLTGLKRRKSDLPEGVTFSNRKKNPYRASICKNGKKHSLGNFSSSELASAAYQVACLD